MDSKTLQSLILQSGKIYLDEYPQQDKIRKIWKSRWRAKRINTSYGLVLEEGKDNGRYSDLYEKYREEFLNKNKR